MSWQKHFQVVNTDLRLKKALERNRMDHMPTSAGTGSKFSSYLPEVYAGHPLRIERYSQYDQMNQDSEISAALDTIADFCTQFEEKTGQIFDIKYNGDPSDTEVEILKTCLNQWSRVNDFKKRVWRIFRSTLQYGDQFFIRDPETLKWHWVDQAKVEKVMVNEADGKEPEQYLIRELDLNLQTLTATASNAQGVNSGFQPSGTNANRWAANAGRQNNTRFNDGNQSLYAVDATHVVHLSLSEGLDANWPFGTSILESVFKTYRQKELLEDAVIIYRIQRAPERRVFYVDVGQMPPHKAGAYLERMKNEIQQKRIPTRSGGGSSVVDAAYNPMSMMDDYFFAQTAEGRGSRVETLPGGEQLGQIDDLRYFNNKLIRGLRVPSSYLPTGPEDGQQAFTDGRVGTAYIQEFRFARYCMRLQNLISTVFDDEFKLFVKQRGYNVDASLYELNFNPPMYFGDFAQIERDAAQINVFQPMSEVKYMSKRFLLKRFLGLSEDEILENEKMWLEENKDATQNSGADGAVGTADAPGLDSIGLRPGDEGDDLGDLGDDMDMEADMEGGDGSESPISGGNTGGEDNPL